MPAIWICIFGMCVAQGEGYAQHTHTHEAHSHTLRHLHTYTYRQLKSWNFVQCVLFFVSVCKGYLYYNSYIIVFVNLYLTQQQRQQGKRKRKHKKQTIALFIQI